MIDVVIKSPFPWYPGFNTESSVHARHIRIFLVHTVKFRVFIVLPVWICSSRQSVTHHKGRWAAAGRWLPVLYRGVGHNCMAQLYCVVIWHRYIRHRSTLWHKLNSYYVQFNSSAAYDLVLTQTQISTQYTGCSNQSDARVIHNSSSYTDNPSLPSWSSLSSAQWALKRRDFESNPGGILQ